MNEQQRHPKPIAQQPTMADLDRQIILELLRQARASFTVALGFTAIATAISLAGATLLLGGKLSEGSLATASGILGTSYCVRLAKECNDRLDNQHDRLNRLHDSGNQ